MKRHGVRMDSEEIRRCKKIPRRSHVLSEPSVEDSLRRYYLYATRTNRPATDEALSCLEQKSASAKDVEHKTACSLCLEQVKEGEMMTELPCGHAFHCGPESRSKNSNCSKTCCGGITRWLKSNRTCPQCRIPVVAPSEVPDSSEKLLIPVILNQYKIIREQCAVISDLVENSERKVSPRMSGGEGNRALYVSTENDSFAPFNCVSKINRAWQREVVHSETRDRILKKIWSILFSQLKEAAQSSLTRAQAEKLDRISRRIESTLFLEASSFVEYENSSTLHVRTMKKLHFIMKICRPKIHALKKRLLQTTTSGLTKSD